MDDETRQYLKRNGIDPDSTTTDSNGNVIPFLDSSGRVSQDAYNAIAAREVELIRVSERFQAETRLAEIAAGGGPLTAAEVLDDPARGSFIRGLAAILSDIGRYFP